MLTGFDEITILRGSKFYGTWQWTNDDTGQAEDLSGLSATIKIKNIHEEFEDVKNTYEVGVATVEPLDIEGNPIKGRIDISLSKEDTLKFSIPDSEEDRYGASDFYSIMTVTLSNSEVILQAKVKVVETLESETLNNLLDEKDEIIILAAKIDDFLLREDEFVTERDLYLQTLATAQSNVDTKYQEILAKYTEITTTASEVEGLKNEVEIIFDNFDDRYLGAFTTDPTNDNDGETLVAGQIYYNTTAKELRFYNGISWDSPVGAAQTYASAASDSEANALTYKNEAKSYRDSASSSATISTTKASEASSSASSAASSASSALSSKNSAATSEANALTYKTEAATSALNAQASEADALAYKNSASSSASSASTSAATATSQAIISTTKASEATNSASNASVSEANALEYLQNIKETTRMSQVLTMTDSI